MTSTVGTRVTEAMVAQLGGNPVHPVLATTQMIEWMEWAGRCLILPYLEDDEDAVGYAIDVVHLAPTLVGEEFRVTATLDSVDGDRVIVSVKAENVREIIGKGRFVQVLVSKELWGQRIQIVAQVPEQEI